MPFRALTSPTSDSSSSSGGGSSDFRPLSSTGAAVTAQTQQPAPQKTSFLGKVGKSISDLFTGGVKATTQDAYAGLGGGEKQYQDALQSYGKTKDNLVNHIKTMQDSGQDTTALQGVLTQFDGTKPKIEDFTGSAIDKTPGQVVGDVTSAALDATPFVPGGAAEDIAADAGKGFVKKAAITGAKEGAIYGGGQGFATGLQNKEGVGKTAVDTAVGTAAGAVTGAALGAATTKTADIFASKATKATRAADEETTKAISAITPNTKDLTPTEYEDALKKGKITPKTKTSAPQYIVSDSEKATAKKFSSLLQNKDPVKNSISVMNEIASKDKEVGQFLDKNNGIFNKGELKNYLSEKMKDITDLSVDETRTDKAKKTLIDNFTNDLDTNNMKSLWKNRKAYDKKIDSAFSGSPTLQKEIKVALRNGVQDFIADRTPNGVYKGYMKDMSGLFDVHDTIATKAAKEKGLNALQAWAKANPTKAKVIGWGTGLIGAGVATDHFFGSH